MGMRETDKEELMNITIRIVEDLATLESEKERMEALKDYTKTVQMIQPVVSALVFEEKSLVREDILVKFRAAINKIRAKV